MIASNSEAEQHYFCGCVQHCNGNDKKSVRLCMYPDKLTYTTGDYKTTTIMLDARCRFQWHTSKYISSIEGITGFSIWRYENEAQDSTVEPENIHLLNSFHKTTRMLFDATVTDVRVIDNLYKSLQNHLIQLNFHEHYRAVKKIGKGTFASVYLAQHKFSGKQFAVKAFVKEKIEQEEKGYACLYNEIKIMRALSSSHIVRLYEIWEADKTYYFVLDLCQGGVLTEKLSKARKYEQAAKISSMREIPLTEEDKRVYLKQLLKALSHMQKVGIMHRDIKPDNILLRSKLKQDALLSDFGLATFSVEKQYLYPKCGTPGYVAPEIINKRGEKEDLKNWKYSTVCDMFSLGATFFFMLTLRQLFYSPNTKETIELNKACLINFEASDLKTQDPKAIDLLKRMLEYDPRKRITPDEALKHPYITDSALYSKDHDSSEIEDMPVSEEDGAQLPSQQMGRLNHNQFNVHLMTSRSNIADTQSSVTTVHSSSAIQPQAKPNRLMHQSTLPTEETPVRSLKDPFAQTDTNISHSSTAQSIRWQRGSQESLDGLVTKNHHILTTSQMFSINEKMDEGSAGKITSMSPSNVKGHSNTFFKFNSHNLIQLQQHNVQLPRIGANALTGAPQEHSVEEDEEEKDNGLNTSFEDQLKQQPVKAAGPKK